MILHTVLIEGEFKYMEKSTVGIFDEANKHIDNYINIIANTKTINFGSTEHDILLALTDTFTNDLWLVRYGHNDKEIEKLGLIIREAYKRVHYNELVHNDDYLLGWLIKHRYVQANTKRVDIKLKKRFAFAVSRGYKDEAYIIAMLLINRKAFSMNDYDIGFELLNERASLLTPAIPFRLLARKCDWAKGNRDCYKLKMELNNYQDIMIDEIF